MNKEVIFAIRYENPTRTQKRDATVRPITFSMNNTGGNHPTQEVIDRFPTIDGGTYTYADWEKGRAKISSPCGKIGTNVFMRQSSIRG